MSKAGEDKTATTTNDSAAKESSAGIDSSQNAPRATSVNPAGPSRVLGNQAKRQEEVTRHGTQKMKYVVHVFCFSAYLI